LVESKKLTGYGFTGAPLVCARPVIIGSQAAIGTSRAGPAFRRRIKTGQRNGIFHRFHARRCQGEPGATIVTKKPKLAPRALAGWIRLAATTPETLRVVVNAIPAPHFHCSGADLEKSAAARPQPLYDFGHPHSIHIPEAEVPSPGVFRTTVVLRTSAVGEFLLIDRDGL